MKKLNHTGGIDISRVETFVYRAPSNKPVKTSFGTMYDRPAILVRLEDIDGGYGWGEVWCNFPSFGAEHRAMIIKRILSPLLLKRHFNTPETAFHHLTKSTHVLASQTGEYGPLSQAIAGVDIAIWDLAARRAQIPLYGMFGVDKRIAVPVYASGISPEGAEKTVGICRKNGFRAFKIKVGFKRTHDLKNIQNIIRNANTNEKLMIDANQAWDLETAKQIIKELEEYPISWLEEPIQADRPFEDWRYLSRSTKLLLAAGENYRSCEKFMSAIKSKSISVIQPSTCKWGCITGCIKIAKEALKAGLRYCPHFLGGGIGLLASAHLLAAAGGDGLLEFDSNPNPLREGLAQPFPLMQSGHLYLNSVPGLGVDPDLSYVQSFLVGKREIY